MRPLLEGPALITEVKAAFPGVGGVAGRMKGANYRKGREKSVRAEGTHMQRNWAGRKGACRALGTQRGAAGEGK